MPKVRCQANATSDGNAFGGAKPTERVPLRLEVACRAGLFSAVLFVVGNVKNRAVRGMLEMVLHFAQCGGRSMWAAWLVEQSVGRRGPS